MRIHDDLLNTNNKKMPSLIGHLGLIFDLILPHDLNNKY